MALKAIIAKLEEVPEQYRDLYAQQGDKYVIQVDGVKTQADVDKLTTALQKERTDHAATKATAKEATDKLAAFGETTPESIQASLDKLATLEAAHTPELAKNFEKIVAERVASQLEAKLKAETAKLNKQLTDLTTANHTLTEENGGLKQSQKLRTIDDAVRAAASSLKLNEAAIPDALMHAHQLFDVDPEGGVKTKDGVIPAEWLETRKTTSPHWWPAAVGAKAAGSDGVTASGSDNPFSNAGWNMTKQSQLVNTDPAKADRLAKLAGTTVGGPKPPKA